MDEENGLKEKVKSGFVLFKAERLYPLITTN